MSEHSDTNHINAPKSAGCFDDTVVLKAKLHAESAVERASLRERAASMSPEEREEFQARFDQTASRITAQFGRSTRYISPKENS